MKFSRAQGGRVRRGRASHEIEWESVRESDGKGRRKRRVEQRGIYGRRKSGETHAGAPYPIRRPLNPGGQTPRQKLLNMSRYCGFGC
jgi:hypothetical protein